jgi:hypothetical protein
MLAHPVAVFERDYALRNGEANRESEWAALPPSRQESTGNAKAADDVRGFQALSGLWPGAQRQKETSRTNFDQSRANPHDTSA